MVVFVVGGVCLVRDVHTERGGSGSLSRDLYILLRHHLGAPFRGQRSRPRNATSARRGGCTHRERCGGTRQRRGQPDTGGPLLHARPQVRGRDEKECGEGLGCAHLAHEFSRGVRGVVHRDRGGLGRAEKTWKTRAFRRLRTSAKGMRSEAGKQRPGHPFRASRTGPPRSCFGVSWTGPGGGSRSPPRAS